MPVLLTAIVQIDAKEQVQWRVMSGSDAEAYGIADVYSGGSIGLEHRASGDRAMADDVLAAIEACSARLERLATHLAISGVLF